MLDQVYRFDIFDDIRNHGVFRRSMVRIRVRVRVRVLVIMPRHMLILTNFHLDPVGWMQAVGALKIDLRYHQVPYQE